MCYNCIMYLHVPGTHRSIKYHHFHTNDVCRKMLKKLAKFTIVKQISQIEDFVPQFSLIFKLFFFSGQQPLKFFENLSISFKCKKSTLIQPQSLIKRCSMDLAFFCLHYFGHIHMRHVVGCQCIVGEAQLSKGRSGDSSCNDKDAAVNTQLLETQPIAV